MRKCRRRTSDNDLHGPGSAASPKIKCREGWYLELLHPDSTVTRYCHMLRRPPVEVGQQVAIGQIVGHIGSSGNSSGPHLHLETHTGQPATESNAVDPVGFFAIRGIDLTAT
ncbi:M23 family metallopeptidase [Micromonospora sp. Llam0]|uniref:M23 family metallopeptidase n=1 Tax=Micromonospora sp. Llam0 TaxID=2485143 RepID=UPI00210449EB|nr:M23 family metallopeptidase [Micromonospora sp. Llam0]